MIHQLIYTSAAADCLNEVELIELLEQARKNNVLRDVTGMLLHAKGHFLQVLEGEATTVQERFERIKTDERHRDCCLVHVQDVTERSFPDWSMGSRDIKPGSAAEGLIRALHSIGDLDSLTRDQPEMLQLWMQAFGEAHLEPGTISP